jgi:hypothetical protein
MKTILIALIMLTLLLAACSQIPYEDRVKYCESKGMEISNSEKQGYFYCRISDLNYVREDLTGELQND